MELTQTYFGAGWIRLHIAIENVDYYIDASNILNDAIGDLLYAVIKLHKGSEKELVTFYEEPGTHLWRLQREDHRIKITRYDLKTFRAAGEITKRNLDNMEPVGSSATDLKTLTNQVIRLVSSFKSEPGIEGYEQEWGYRFPQNELTTLMELRRHSKKTNNIVT